MNNEHFLKTIFLRKNKKGELREFRLTRKRNRPHVEPRIIHCSHCGLEMATPKGRLVSGGICQWCLVRARGVVNA